MISSAQFGDQIVINAPAAVKQPSAILNASGTPLRKQTKEELNSRYFKNREAFKSRMEKAKILRESQTPESLMRKSGRSEEFIQKHLQDVKQWEKQDR